MAGRRRCPAAVRLRPGAPVRGRASTAASTSAATPGDAVLAPAGGTVTFAGSVPGSGKSVTITTADGYAVTLTHLGSIAVAQGAAVAEGDAVGTIGPSGDPEVVAAVRAPRRARRRRRPGLSRSAVVPARRGAGRRPLRRERAARRRPRPLRRRRRHLRRAPARAAAARAARRRLRPGLLPLRRRSPLPQPGRCTPRPAASPAARATESARRPPTHDRGRRAAARRADGSSPRTSCGRGRGRPRRAPERATARTVGEARTPSPPQRRRSRRRRARRGHTRPSRRVAAEGSGRDARGSHDRSRGSPRARADGGAPCRPSALRARLVARPALGPARSARRARARDRARPPVARRRRVRGRRMIPAVADRRTILVAPAWPTRRTPAPGARGRIWRPVGHLGPLPPAQGQDLLW